MPQIRIRALSQGDWPQWRGLWDGYRRFYGRPDQDEAAFRRDFDRLLTGDPHDFHALVAEGAGTLLGLTHYLFHANMRYAGGICYLQDLFTRPEARGRGVGRALIEAVAEQASRRGAGEVYWLTAEDNYAGRMLYDRVAARTPFIKYARPL